MTYEKMIRTEIEKLIERREITKSTSDKRKLDVTIHDLIADYRDSIGQKQWSRFSTRSNIDPDLFTAKAFPILWKMINSES